MRGYQNFFQTIADLMNNIQNCQSKAIAKIWHALYQTKIHTYILRYKYIDQNMHMHSNLSKLLV